MSRRGPAVPLIGAAVGLLLGLGITLLQESIHETTIGAVATMLALVGALAGMTVLATGESGRPPPKPGPPAPRGDPSTAAG